MMHGQRNDSKEICRLLFIPNFYDPNALHASFRNHLNPKHNS